MAGECRIPCASGTARGVHYPASWWQQGGVFAKMISLGLVEVAILSGIGVFPWLVLSTIVSEAGILARKRCRVSPQ